MDSAGTPSHNSFRVSTFGAVVACMAAAQVARAQVGFTPNPATPLATGWSIGGATPDLHVMAGTYFHNFTHGNVAARWTATGEFQQLPFAPGTFSGHATGISNEGQIVIGYGSLQGGGSAAWRWAEPTGTELLPFGEGFTSAQALAISHDGAIVGGVRGPSPSERAILWTPGGITEIPLPDGYSRGWVNALNAAGDAATGYYSMPSQPFKAYRWTQSGGVETLVNAPGWDGAFATEMSDDGGTIAGRAFNGSETRPFRWTPAAGMQVLDILGGAITSDLSADGSVLVGAYSPGGGTQRAYYWSEGTGFIDVMDHLSANGIDLTGWWLHDAQAVSDDGLTIAGRARYTDAMGVARGRTWTATVPSPGSGLVLGLLAGLRVRRRRSQWA